MFDFDLFILKVLFIFSLVCLAKSLFVFLILVQVITGIYCLLALLSEEESVLVFERCTRAVTDSVAISGISGLKKAELNNQLSKDIIEVEKFSDRGELFDEIYKKIKSERNTIDRVTATIKAA